MSTASAIRQALAIWNGARRADSQHPYLKRHRIGPLQLRQTRRGDLVMPLCTRGSFRGVRLIPWDLSAPVTALGITNGSSVPTARHQLGTPLAVTVDWPSAVAMHKQGITAWACMSLDNLGLVAFQARSIIGDEGRLIVVGDNTEEGARRADMVATSRGAELLLPRRPMGASQWVETFGDLALWQAGVRRVVA